jgi:hypothetical protein
MRGFRQDEEGRLKVTRGWGLAGRQGKGRKHPTATHFLPLILLSELTHHTITPADRYRARTSETDDTN